MATILEGLRRNTAVYIHRQMYLCLYILGMLKERYHRRVMKVPLKRGNHTQRQSTLSVLLCYVSIRCVSLVDGRQTNAAAGPFSDGGLRVLVIAVFLLNTRTLTFCDHL